MGKKAKMSESEALGIAIEFLSAVDAGCNSSDDDNSYKKIEEAEWALRKRKADLDKPPIKMNSRKAKGLEFQRVIRADLIEMGIDPVDILSTPAGRNGCDIYLAAAARKLFPFGVECKNQESLKIWEAWEQARTNAEAEGLRPMLIFRRNKHETLVAVEWNIFKKMLRLK